MFSYDALATSFSVLLSACAALAIIWSAVKAIKGILKPHADLANQIAEHERKLANDHERLDDLETSNNLQAKILLQIANHMIDGNHTDLLRRARDEMQEFLIMR